jgi:non-ribosomal peptide synthetase component F
MVSQVKAKVFLTSPTQYPRFAAEITDAMVIVVDEKLFRELDDLPLESLPIKPILPQSTAMIVFTSGSTGQPKGIEIMHGSFVTFATGLGPFVDIGHDTRVLQFCAYAFDASNADVFMTWINGGCLCIPSDYERLNDLTGAINRLRATWINITPSATALIESPAAVPTVKTIKLVGEPSRQDIVDTWSPFVKVFNGYGPAEVTVEWLVSPFLVCYGYNCKRLGGNLRNLPRDST